MKTIKAKRTKRTKRTKFSPSRLACLVVFAASPLLFGGIPHASANPHGQGETNGPSNRCVTGHSLTRRKVHSILEAIRNQTGVPALAAAFVTPCGVVADTVGVLRSDKPDPASDSSLFELGSTTKPITATLAAILVERGKLRWNTTVSEVFPDFAAQINPAFKKATLEQILAHRAGLPTFGSLDDFTVLNMLIGTPRQQRHTFAKNLLTQSPAFTPGDWNYSNAGYGVAAAMIENVADDSYEHLLNSLLMQPLRVDLNFGPPAFNDPNQPWGHDADENADLTPHDPNDTSFALNRISGSLTPASFVTLNAEGFGRFAQMHLRGLLGMNTILRPATVQHLHTPIGSHLSGQGYEIFCDLGWFQTKLNGETIWFHTGTPNGTFATLIVVAATRKIAAVIMTNAGDGVRGTAALTEGIQKLTGIKISADFKLP